MGKCIEGMLSNGDLITVGIAKLCCPSGTSPYWSTWTLLGLHLRTCFCGQYSGAHTHTELLMQMQPHPAHTHTQCHRDIHTFPQRCTPTLTQCPTHIPITPHTHTSVQHAHKGGRTGTTCFGTRYHTVYTSFLPSLPWPVQVLFCFSSYSDTNCHLACILALKKLCTTPLPALHLHCS